MPIKKKEIVDHTVLATGMRKRDVREVLDSAFGYIRQQLLGGEDVAYAELGKLKVNIQNAGLENEKTVYRLILGTNSDQEQSGGSDLVDLEEPEPEASRY